MPNKEATVNNEIKIGLKDESKPGDEPMTEKKQESEEVTHAVKGDSVQGWKGSPRAEEQINVRLGRLLVEEVRKILIDSVGGSAYRKQKNFSKVVERALQEYCAIVKSKEGVSLEKSNKVQYFQKKFNDSVSLGKHNGELIAKLEKKVKCIEEKLNNMLQLHEPNTK